MRNVEEYIDLTKKMIQLVEEPIKGDERDTIIEQVMDLMEERQAVMKQVQPPYSEAEKELGAQAIMLDKHLQHKLSIIFQKIKKDMRETKKQHKSNQQYLNPYKNLANYDAMFLDSKK
ncbi:hypothetical protein [Gracilibacillus sp. YIM 98692]|uniref:hypothetical protein n=1 Tax=Gracilibacillus sp. YIM 98692 TaxID=2663532 RepID=UPI0013D85F7A|nr:hypothetical protein [Gracilibacillus sp. YIM 98692]